MSAVKVDGRRSYDRVRAGEAVELAPRSVTVHRLEVHRIERPTPDLVDVDVTVTCTAGTYIRAIARDAGAALGVGGHLTALRRTASGPFAVAQAAPVEDAGAALLAGGGTGFLGLTEAATTVFPARPLTDEEARALVYGQRIPATGAPGLHAAVDPDGRLAALVEDAGTTARVAVGFPPSVTCGNLPDVSTLDDRLAALDAEFAPAARRPGRVLRRRRLRRGAGRRRAGAGHRPRRRRDRRLAQPARVRAGRRRGVRRLPRGPARAAAHRRALPGGLPRQRRRPLRVLQVRTGRRPDAAGRPARHRRRRHRHQRRRPAGRLPARASAPPPSAAPGRRWPAPG